MELFSSRDRTRTVKLTGQGYHPINWDNPGYPGLLTFGPERGPEEVTILRRKVRNAARGMSLRKVSYKVFVFSVFLRNQ